jgi:hypothetical protein
MHQEGAVRTERNAAFVVGVILVGDGAAASVGCGLQF